MDVVVEETRIQEFKCNLCNTQFSEKADLRNHIKTTHKTYKPCLNFATNSCGDGGDCRYNHVIPAENTSLCFKCGSTFNSKPLLHNHGFIPCIKFQKGNCPFNSERCFFSHTIQQPQAHQPRPQQAQAGKPQPRPQQAQDEQPQEDFRLAEPAGPPDQTEALKSKMMTVFSMMLDRMPPQALPQIFQQLQM